MEDLDESITAIQQKILRLNNFIALQLRRDGISKELQQLVTQAASVRNLLAEAHTVMLEQHTKLADETKEVMAQMREKQNLMLAYLIKEKQRKLKEEAEAASAEVSGDQLQLCLGCGNGMSAVMNSAIKSRGQTTPVPKSAVKCLGLNFAQLQLQQGRSVTPKIKISEYKSSPLVKKKLMPVAIQFTEFDVQITQQQFDKIPKYMCGRENLEQLNSFLDTVIIPCFNEKYQLMHKVRNALRNQADVELWKMYNDQASYLPGKMFITPGDITRIVNKMLDKKAQNRLTMLRHLGILQEQRIKQTVCYIWSYSGF